MISNCSRRKQEEAEMMVTELRNRLQIFSQLCWLILEQELWEAVRFCIITAVCLSDSRDMDKILGNRE